MQSLYTKACIMHVWTKSSDLRCRASYMGIKFSSILPCSSGIDYILRYARKNESFTRPIIRNAHVYVYVG